MYECQLNCSLKTSFIVKIHVIYQICGEKKEQYILAKVKVLLLEAKFRRRFGRSCFRTRKNGKKN
jgi:hypothetical protein